MISSEQLFDELWPLNRSLTGDGNRETLRILSKISDININEIPSGTKLFDWSVPPEYNIKRAYILNSKKERIIDFKVNNLHLVGYSEPISKWMNFSELEEHLHYIEEMPDAIPYVTSYYQSYWGFCMTYNQFKSLNREENYYVHIESVKDPKGTMTIGERFFKGQIDKEILISTYICHPSMANNELSGPILTIFLQKMIENYKERYYSYRFVYVPETIGALAVLDKYGESLKSNLVAGFVVTCVGDSGQPTFKKSRKGNTLIDRLVEFKLKEKYKNFILEDFFPTGSDERQYCSPYFNLPVCSLMKTRYGRYKEYHTSLDNKELMDFNEIDEFTNFYFEILSDFEKLKLYTVSKGKGEPFLNKYSLYQSIGANKKIPNQTNLTLWILNKIDKDFDLIDLANATGSTITDISSICELLKDKGLLREFEKNEE